MKLFVSLFFIALISGGYYFYFSSKSKNNKKSKQKRVNWKIASMTLGIVFVLLALLGTAMYISATAPDTQCTKLHTTTSHQIDNPQSAIEFFMQGNYNYDRGNCKEAITDYTKSISLNPNYPQAYNNRAYTYMRMQDYKDALPDLNKALALNPTYIQALMNRGDIHNYYFAIDKNSAILDYEAVISLGGGRATSVCGHLLLARHNGWNLGTILAIPNALMVCH